MLSLIQINTAGHTHHTSQDWHKWIRPNGKIGIKVCNRSWIWYCCRILPLTLDQILFLVTIRVSNTSGFYLHAMSFAISRNLALFRAIWEHLRAIPKMFIKESCLKILNLIQKSFLSKVNRLRCIFQSMTPSFLFITWCMLSNLISLIHLGKERGRISVYEKVLWVTWSLMAR